MKLKIIIGLLLISLMLAGCTQESEEQVLDRGLIEGKITELNNLNEISEFSNCAVEFNDLLSEPYPKIDDLNIKYFECDTFVPIIISKSESTIEFIKTKIGLHTLDFDREIDNYIRNANGVRVGISGSISKMKLDMINLTFSKITQTCIKEDNAIMCTECCQNNFDSEALSYYNKCKLECLILEE